MLSIREMDQAAFCKTGYMTLSDLNGSPYGFIALSLEVGGGG